MANWDQVPRFGERTEGVECVIRPSAYGLFADARGQLAIVRTGEGFFLPGGGIEAGETPAATIQREAREECGFVVHVGTWTRHAVEFSYSPSARVHCEKRSVFMDGAIERFDFRLEEDHELHWAKPDRAIAMLSHASHAWAVQEWRSRA